MNLSSQISNSINHKSAEIFMDKRYKPGLVNGVGTLFKPINENLDRADNISSKVLITN